MTLHSGDVIMSGIHGLTIGPVVPCDVMHAQMDGIGEMTVQMHGGTGRKTPMVDMT
jgi:2-keto-4-pentenoate hydratase/2-oxohepta-3-ene-1,7-dioic acid hydratase in catechol pathway